jgi:uncharacterized protein Usg
MGRWREAEMVSTPQLIGWGLTTAFILYRLPDFKSLLQTYIWQEYDNEPDFPKLRAFLDWWQANLDGPLFSVKIVHRLLIMPDDFKINKWLN